MHEAQAPELLIILIAGLAVAAAFRHLGQSLILGYVLAGMLLGPHVISLIHAEGALLRSFSEAGVFFLLFSIGLEMSPNELRKDAPQLGLASLVQMLVVAGPAALILGLCGFSRNGAIIAGLALSLSSTVLVFKALHEHGMQHTRLGRASVGVLVFQDIALAPILLAIPLLTGTQSQSAWDFTRAILEVAIGLVLGRYIFKRYILKLLVAWRSTELVVLFILALLGLITWRFGVLGLPASLGALGAGVIMAETRITHQFDALILPFREAFAAVFFVAIGLLIDPALLWQHPLIIILGILSIIALKAGAGTLAMRSIGLPWVQARLGGLGIAQVGEFALVLLLQAQAASLLQSDQLNILLFISLATFALTPFLIEPAARRRHGDTEEHPKEESLQAPLPQDAVGRAVVIGTGPVGMELSSVLLTADMQVVAVDISQVNLTVLSQMGAITVVGDASDATVLRQAQIQRADLIVVTIPNDNLNLQVIRSIRQINLSATLLVRCRFIHNGPDLINAGATKLVQDEIEISRTISMLALGAITAKPETI